MAEGTRQHEINSAQCIYDQAHTLFEVTGFVSRDPRLTRACQILRMPQPTSDEAIGWLKDRAARNMEEAEKARSLSRQRNLDFYRRY